MTATRTSQTDDNFEVTRGMWRGANRCVGEIMGTCCCVACTYSCISWCMPSCFSWIPSDVQKNFCFISLACAALPVATAVALTPITLGADCCLFSKRKINDYRRESPGPATQEMTEVVYQPLAAGR